MSYIALKVIYFIRACHAYNILWKLDFLKLYNCKGITYETMHFKKICILGISKRLCCMFPRFFE